MKDKLETYKERLRDKEKVYNRLKYLFDGATESDTLNGLFWYKSGNEFAVDCAIKYGFRVDTVCAVISALSPAVSWPQNKIDAESLLRSVSVGETDPKKISASTYGPQVEKALNIAWTNNLSLLGNGLKTTSFALNLLGIQDHSVCTIDRHMLGAAVGSRSALHQSVSITQSRYFAISAQIKRLARNRNVLPKQCQAIVWLAYRSKLGYSNES